MSHRRRALVLIAGCTILLLLALLLFRPALALAAVLIIGLMALCRRSPQPGRRLLWAVAVCLMTTAGLESVLLAVRHHPGLSRVLALTGPARELYMLDRALIQYEPDCARYDPRLGYTLRPGEFSFANTEFDVRFEVNRLGFRDDEASVKSPEIVVIGDSFAMGWGVAQEQSFAEVLETISGRTVLNTAISSWGTARQLRALEAIDLGAASHLIIQFCNNDFFENQRFKREGPGFAVLSEAEYLQAAAAYAEARSYFPGRYAATLLGRRLAPLWFWRPLRPASERKPPSSEPDPRDMTLQREQVELFLNVLAHHQARIGHLRIIVFELNAYNRDVHSFIPLLAEAIARPGQPGYVRRMQAVNLAAALGHEHFFTLDDHLNAAGHRHIAERLNELARMGSVE